MSFLAQTCQDIVHEIFSFLPADIYAYQASYYGSPNIAYRFKNSTGEIFTAPNVKFKFKKIPDGLFEYSERTIARVISRANIRVCHYYGEPHLLECLHRLIVRHLPITKSLAVDEYRKTLEPVIGNITAVQLLDLKQEKLNILQLPRLKQIANIFDITTDLNSLEYILKAGMTIICPQLTINECDVTEGAVAPFIELVKKYPGQVKIKYLLCWQTCEGIETLIALSLEVNIDVGRRRIENIKNITYPITKTLTTRGYPPASFTSNFPRLQKLEIEGVRGIRDDVFDGRYKAVSIYGISASNIKMGQLERIARKYDLRITVGKNSTSLRRAIDKPAGVFGDMKISIYSAGTIEYER